MARPNSKEPRTIQPSRLFLWLAPLLYAAFALLTPPFQTPDEHQHLFRAWQLSEFQLIGERRGDAAGGVLPSGLGRAALPEVGTLEPHPPRSVVERPFSTVFDRGTTPDTDAPRHFFNFLGSVVYSPAGYLPQIAAVWLGRAVGFSVEGIVRLGRLLNGAATILLIYSAIRLTPVGALAIFWVGLLPMTASASAAFGQVGIVIGGACLLTAIGLRVVLNSRWDRSDILITAMVTIVMTLSKFIYLPLALIGGQPFVGRAFEWRRLAMPMLICVIAAGLLVVWLNEISALAIRPQGIPPAAERLQLWLDRPSELLMLLERTYIWNGGPLLGSLFSFGWLNVGPVNSSAIMSGFACALVLIAGNTANGQLKLATRVWLVTIATSIILLLSIAMYLYWTPASEIWIQGLQGRYFIPVMPALLVALLPNRIQVRELTGLIALLMVGANLIGLEAVVAAFYYF